MAMKASSRCCRPAPMWTAVPRTPLFSTRRLAGHALRRPTIAAAATVKDQISGAEFPLAQQFWSGETMRCLGATTKGKKIVFVSVQVYSVALFVEGDKCAKELGIRSRGGFFETDQDFCTAIMDGAFQKVLSIRLLRDVDGQTFADALNKSLVPRMQLSGELDKLSEFMALFQEKKLTNGTEVVLLCNTAGETGVLVVPTAAASYSSMQPEKTIKSVALNRGLLELYLGSTPVVPDAQPIWVEGAKNLLDYENVKRNVRKAGSG